MMTHTQQCERASLSVAKRELERVQGESTARSAARSSKDRIIQDASNCRFRVAPKRIKECVFTGWSVARA